MADQKNKTWNVNQNTVTQLNTVADRVESLAQLWADDPRYSGGIEEAIRCAASIRVIAGLVQTYLPVQGT
jgi:hypothetical protein